MKDLNRIKDFPRHRRLSECADDTPVVSSEWEFSDAEKAELSAKFPRATGVSHVRIERRYKAATKYVTFIDLKPIAFSPTEVASRIRKIKPAIEAAAAKLEEAPQAEAKAAIVKFETDLGATGDATVWAQTSEPGLANFAG